MGVISDAAVSRGDLMKRLDEIEARLDRAETARRSVSTAIGSRGVRVHSGGSVRLEGGGSLLVDDGGDVRVVGGQIVIQDPSGAETFRAGTDGLSLTGLLQVLGGGDIAVTEGRLVASDEAGEVFAVDPTVPRIFMRKALIRSLVDDLVEELLVSPAGQTLAAFVLGQRVHVDSVATTETTSSATYTDLATTGPTVSGVSISDSGKALVMLGTFESSTVPDGNGSEGAVMSVQISGATSVAPNDDDAVWLSLTNHNANGSNHSVSTRSSFAIAVEGLNPGTHTFRAKYRATSGTARFAGRHLAVIAL